jgi:hypothetical protein
MFKKGRTKLNTKLKIMCGSPKIFARNASGVYRYGIAGVMLALILTCMPGCAGGLFQSCESLAEEAAQIAMEAQNDPFNADVCRASQIAIAQFDQNCGESALPEGISEAEFREQLVTAMNAFCQ